MKKCLRVENGRALNRRKSVGSSVSGVTEVTITQMVRALPELSADNDRARACMIDLAKHNVSWRRCEIQMRVSKNRQMS